MDYLASRKEGNNRARSKDKGASWCMVIGGIQCLFIIIACFGKECFIGIVNPRVVVPSHFTFYILHSHEGDDTMTRRVSFFFLLL